MSTNWKYTVHVICSAESMPGAIQALDIAFPKDDGTPRDASQPQQMARAYHHQPTTLATRAHDRLSRIPLS